MKKHINLLKKYLIHNGFNNTFINSAVVFVGKYSVVIEKNTKIGTFIISGIEELEMYIKNLPDNPRFTKNFCLDVNKLLRNK